MIVSDSSYSNSSGNGFNENLSEEQQQEIATVVDEFLAKLRKKENPDRSEFILSHPHLAKALEVRLRAAEKLYRIAENLSQPLSETSGSEMPEFVGRFQIRQEIGRGASSKVYRAFDPRLEREIALKVIRWELTDESELSKRFERDAQMAAKLRHPNIVPVHDSGEILGFRYIAMDLIRGETLEARLQRLGPLDLREGAELIRKVAEALHYAHDQGIIHRDVKPSNILLDDRGEPQLTDFGLARRVTEDETLTVHGQILGTPAYMSPEQAEGRAYQVDRRSDVFSLGAVLYRVLSGKMPFGDGNDSLPKLLQRIVQEPPLEFGRENETIPRDLRTICFKALEKEPSARFANTSDMAAELWRWLNDESLTIRPPSIWEKMRRWVRQNRAIAYVSMIAMVLVIAVSVVAAILIYQNQLRSIRSEIQAAAEKAARESEQRSRAEVQAWNLLSQGWQRLRVLDHGKREDILDLLKKAHKESLLTGQEARKQLAIEIRTLFASSLASPDVRKVKQTESLKLPSVFHTSWPAAIHPSGEYAVIGTHLGPLCWKPGKGSVIAGIPIDINTLDPDLIPRPLVSFSLDGKFLAFAKPGEPLQLWDEAAKNTIKTLGKGDNANRIIAIWWSKNSRSLCVVADDGKIQEWSLADFEQIGFSQIKLEADFSITTAAFSPGGKEIVFGDETGVVKIYDRDHQTSRDLCSIKSEITVVGWSPDGNLIVVGGRHGTLQLWNAKVGQIHTTLGILGIDVRSVCFSPDSRWIFAHNQVWDTRSGQKVLNAPTPAGTFAADAKRYVWGSVDKVPFYEFQPPEAHQHLVGHQAIVVRTKWSRNGKFLVSLDNQFEIRVWDVQTFREVDNFTKRGTHFALNSDMAISDDGRFVAYVSGGDKESFALIRDTQMKKTVGGPWKLPGGYERVGFNGKHFILVREEPIGEPDPMDKQPRQSVVYELTIDHPPRKKAILRHSQEGDLGFYDHGISWDGNFYFWQGPRYGNLPRVEVFDVFSGKRVLLHRRPVDGDEPRFFSSDGKHFWIGTKEHTTHIDLADPVHSKKVTAIPCALASTLTWSVFHKDDLPLPHLSLQRDVNGSEWLQIRENGPLMLSVSFSPNHRFLTWGEDNGSIVIVDLPLLEKKVAEFEGSLSTN